jgi:hypothetical protein
MLRSDITSENYREYKGISNSIFSYLLPQSGGSVEKFHHKLNEPEEEAEEDSTYVNVGVAVHKFAANPYTYKEVVVNVPPPGVMKVLLNLPKTVVDLKAAEKEIADTAKLVDYGQAWKPDTLVKKVLTEGEEYFEISKVYGKNPEVAIISPDEKKVVSGCIERLKKMDDIMDPAKKWGKNSEVKREFPIAVEIDGIVYKSLLDRLVIDHDKKAYWVEDLKTSSTPVDKYIGYEEYQLNEKGQYILRPTVPEFVRRDVHRQLAFYTMMAGYTLPGYTYELPAVIAIETSAPFAMRYRGLNHGELNTGLAIVQQALNLVKAQIDQIL